MSLAMRAALVACVLVGCASGRPNDGAPDASVGGGPDAKVWRDGSIEGTPDAKPPADAYQCQQQQLELLTNPVLDLNPSGMGWVQQNIDNAAPIITGDDGVLEHSAPFKAWMGGMQGYDYGYYSLTDVLYQDVTVPSGATQLRLTGAYDVRTAEIEAGVYDTGEIALLQPNGTPIEMIKSLSNETPTAGWTVFDHVFAAPHAGQTVRLRLTTTNDIIDPTSFYFDTLSVTATVCQ